mgnify:CR=1 FL=1
MNDTINDFRLDEEDRINDITKMHISGLERNLTSSGHYFAMTSSDAQISKWGAISEVSSGLSYLKRIKELKLSNFNNEHGFANSRARLRMTTLYQVAAANNGIVVGTGNKVEDFCIGFFTKYGDGGVDISPIGDLLKSEVFLLSKYLNIIKEIQDAEPTDGLWDDNRNDEEQIGATYKEIEWAMKNLNNSDLSEKENLIINIYKKHNFKNRHKMLPIPVCIIKKN